MMSEWHKRYTRQLSTFNRFLMSNLGSNFLKSYRLNKLSEKSIKYSLLMCMFHTGWWLDSWNNCWSCCILSMLSKRHMLCKLSRYKLGRVELLGSKNNWRLHCNSYRSLGTDKRCSRLKCKFDRDQWLCSRSNLRHYCRLRIESLKCKWYNR